jgi:hypothetical protein
MLFNCAAWYNITKAEMDLFGTVDLMLLRGVLKAPKSTPYILNQNKESIIYRVFESQRRNRNKKDWVITVLSDLCRRIQMEHQSRRHPEIEEQLFLKHC